MLDLGIVALGVGPFLYRASELNLISTMKSSPVLAEPRWWASVVGISLLYVLHGFIWHCPQLFTSICRPTGRHPVDVFAALEVLGKFWQLACLAGLLGADGIAAVGDALMAAPMWCYAACALYVLAGQTLNMAMYAAIGNDGVYYGFRLGRTVPWCSSFPFNVGLRHPQYVGVVLTILGAAIPMLNDVLIRAGLIQAMLAWASMYVVMCIMEQLNDNDKSDKKS